MRGFFVVISMESQTPSFIFFHILYYAYYQLFANFIIECESI